VEAGAEDGEDGDAFGGGDGGRGDFHEDLGCVSYAKILGRERRCDGDRIHTFCVFLCAEGSLE